MPLLRQRAAVCNTKSMTMNRLIPFSILVWMIVGTTFLARPLHATGSNSGFSHSVANTNDVTVIAECTEIIHSGTYLLESDITGGDDDCLVIKASHVILDGNGFSIIGEENGRGIFLDGSEQLLSHIEIRDVTVDGWTNGLFTGPVTESRITGITARNNTSNGLRLGNISDSVVDSILTYNNRNGIWFATTTRNNQVTHITSRDNTHYGFYVSGSNGNTFEQLTSINNRDGFYVISSNNNLFREVRSDSSRIYGFELRASSRSNRFEQISASYNRWHGMRIGESEHNEFDGVFLYANEMSGIFLVGDLRFNTRVTGNSFRNITATGNEESGISISVAAFNEFNGIVLNDNGQNGITLGSRDHDNIFRNVIIDGTGNHGISVLNNSPDNLFHNIEISNAGTSSIYYAMQFGNDSPGNQIRNVTISSGGGGLSVRTDSTVVDSLAVSGVSGTAVRLWQEAKGNSLSNLFLSDNTMDFQSTGQSTGNSVEYMALGSGAISFLARDIRINHTDPPDVLPGGLEELPYYVEISSSSIAGDEPNVDFIRFYYDPEVLQGWDETTLEIWRYDDESGWTRPAENSFTTGVNTEEKYVYAENITEFSIFAVLSSELPTTVAEQEMLPDAFRLAQNYPNPFNPSTLIRYELPKSAQVRLEVYNLLGERVATLVDARREAGSHQATFDAGHLASGVYLYRLQAGDFVRTKKLTLIR